MYYYCVTLNGLRYKISDARILKNKSEIVYGQTRNKWFIITETVIDEEAVFDKYCELSESFCLFKRSLKKLNPEDEELLKIAFTMEYFCVSLSSVHKAATNIIKKVANKYGLLLN